MKNNHKNFLILVMTAFLSVFYSCSGEKTEQPKIKHSSIEEVTAADWQELREKRIYFGHQSVGYNILDGIRQIMADIPAIQLKIVEIAGPEDFMKTPVFGHSKIGKNREPETKIVEFETIMEKGLAQHVDVAFFKFCYIDINADTDVASLFEKYQKIMGQLKQRYPKIIFVHLTAPLQSLQTKWTDWLKRIFGKPEGNQLENIRRNELNDLIRKAYDGKEPLFDLAKLEAMGPDGKPATFEINSRFYQTLSKGYTEDGGHLNKAGQLHIAKNLLLFLVNLDK